MTFTTEVTGDALDFMMNKWCERDSFTRAELGDVPDWADYVNSDGVLFAEHEMEDLFECDLNDLHDAAQIGSYIFEVGTALRRLDPIAFREETRAWIDARVQDGDLRSIEG